MMKRVLSACLLFVCSLTAAGAEQGIVTATGHGTTDAVPDMAYIEVGVTHVAPTAGEAMALTSDALRNVMAQLEAQNVEPRDMQTQGLSLQPVRERNGAGNGAPAQISGFLARNGLSVRVRDLDGLGGILDTVVRDGANTLNGLRFSVQDSSAALADARASAVKDAMAKAEQLAQAAGVELGDIRSITEGGAAPRPVMMEAAGTRMASDVPVATGEVSFSVHVSMVFEIED